MNIFKEKVEISEDKVVIEVTCEHRTHTKEPKRIYKKDVKSLIPQELHSLLHLKQSPSSVVSNMSIDNHTNSGIWIYEIQKSQQVKPTRPTRKKTSTRRRPRQSKKTS